MKTKDLKIGELYAHKDGKYGMARKARVLEVNVERKIWGRRSTKTANDGVRIRFFEYGGEKEQEKSSVVLVRNIVSTWDDHEKAKAQKEAAEAAYQVQHKETIKVLEEVCEKVFGGHGRVESSREQIVIRSYQVKDLLQHLKQSQQNIRT